MEDTRSTLESQVQIVIRALSGRKISRNGTTPIFQTAVGWMKNFPTFIDPALKEQLRKGICNTFDITESDLLAEIEGVVIVPPPNWTSQEEKLRSVMPKGGWFEWYAEYTNYNEAPLSYHIFSSLCVLGSALGRRVYLDMGHFKIWPNYCTVLVGPTGRVKKTTAADIARDFIHRHVLCPILADEPTPQAMISSLKGSGHHFVYAPEMSVFFGKEKFKEGMIPKFLRMLDSPAHFEVETQLRGKETITDLAISFLGCTTPSLLTTSMPGEVTSSGFMNRFMFIVERNTERIYPRPWKGEYESKLNTVVERFKKLSGEVKFTKEADHWWDLWYRERKRVQQASTDDTLVEVLERLPGHVLRTAMLMHLAQCDTFDLCVSCLEHSKAMIEHVGQNTPLMVQALKQSVTSSEAEFVLDMLVRLGGAADHSTLLRRVASKMNSQTFKGHIRTLEESGRLKVSKRGGGMFYIVTGEVHGIS